MRTRDQKVRVAAARNASSGGVEQPALARIAMPSQLHRRSIAALYAQQKAETDFHRVSRKLFGIQ
jgi:hypothetical protein